MTTLDHTTNLDQPSGQQMTLTVPAKGVLQHPHKWLLSLTRTYRVTFCLRILRVSSFCNASMFGELFCRSNAAPGSAGVVGMHVQMPVLPNLVVQSVFRISSYRLTSCCMSKSL